MRSARSAIDQASESTRNTKIVGPMALWVKECTELKTPERVMKVPRIVNRKAAMTSESVQAFSMRLRSCTMVECR